MSKSISSGKFFDYPNGDKQMKYTVKLPDKAKTQTFSTWDGVVTSASQSMRWALGFTVERTVRELKVLGAEWRVSTGGDDDLRA